MRWKTINTRDFSNSVYEQSCGRGMRRDNIELSPYSVPRAAKIDRGGGYIIVKFDYISPEAEFDQVDLTSMISLKLGQVSRRIYELSINLTMISSQSDLDFALDEASNMLETKIPSPSGMGCRVDKALLQGGAVEISNSWNRG